LHIDVMDGHFVPNITFGPNVVAALRPMCQDQGVVLDVHLMIERPERHLQAFADAGADVLTVHVEACTHLHRTIQEIKGLGMRAGAALNPATPLLMLEEVLQDLDLALIMSVNPGFGGQRYIPQSTDKIRRLRRMLNALGSRAYLEVDGGVGPSNILKVVAAGANVVVAGSAVFNDKAPVADTMNALRSGLLVSA
ncbi:MAG: ribulose-phosphate 3-epimerase, partial [Bacteroidota bacterium]